MKRIVLASASPRRKALLEALGIPLDVRVSGAPERLGGPPEESTVANARAKAESVASELQDFALVVGADTVVALEDRVLGKPADLAEARDMLRTLSGRTHVVVTGLAVVDTGSGKRTEGFERTRVTFRELTAQEIDAFVDAVNPVDRAGAYTVDGPGSLLVEKYEGCYQNVLGLPLVRLDALCRELGVSLFDLMDGAKASFL